MSAPPAPAGVAEDADREFEDLRALLVGPERAAIGELRTRLDDRLAARHVAAVLPEAVAARGRDPRLVRALTPSVEEALLASARRDPRPLADALFPVLAPAIRSAIAHALSAMVESMGRVMEHSVSWRALGWRLTALRTGRPYAEVVLLNTLVYRVEQVFLVHRETGLLLQHVAAPDVPAQSPETVSGMLTAIRDFVADSFGATAGEGVDVLRVGDRAVFVEQGPHALVAAVVRGTPPPELRAVFQEALDTVHLQTGEALEAFDGDDRPFLVVRPVLEQCLRAQRQQRSAAHGRRWLVVLAVGLTALVGWWVVSAWQHRQRDARIVSALRSTPGLVVVSAERVEGRLVVAGLRDPLASEPAAIAQAAGAGDGELEGHWTLYHALDPTIVLARARQALGPPAGVALDWREGTLTVAGAAPAAWLARVAQAAPLLAGVSAVDVSAAAEAELSRLAAAVAAADVQFARGAATLLDGQQTRLDALAADLAALDAVAALAGWRPRVSLTGHADSDGSPESNVPLSRQRAEVVRRLVLPTPPAALDVEVLGAGSTEPVARGGTDADKARNRRVSVRVQQSTGRPS